MRCTLTCADCTERRTVSNLDLETHWCDGGDLRERAISNSLSEPDLRKSILAPASRSLASSVSWLRRSVSLWVAAAAEAAASEAASSLSPSLLLLSAEKLLLRTLQRRAREN